MALVMVNLHGEILDGDGVTPAVGTVRFQIIQELRDTVANIIYAPTEYLATLDLNGEFTISLPTTDNPDVTPLDWTYRVVVATDVWAETFRMSLPGPGPNAEFADLLPTEVGDGSGCTPDGTACAPISHTHGIYVLKAGDTMTGDLTVQAVARLGAKNGLGQIAFAGLKATPGAPAAGAWDAGDTVLDSIGVWHLCTASGTPGVWT